MLERGALSRGSRLCTPGYLREHNINNKLIWELLYSLLPYNGSYGRAKVRKKRDHIVLLLTIVNILSEWLAIYLADQQKNIGMTSPLFLYLLQFR